MAAASLELMTRLGYEQFGAQGGDWGAMVTAQMALQAPERLVGIHLNLVIAPELYIEDVTEFFGAQG